MSILLLRFRGINALPDLTTPTLDDIFFNAVVSLLLDGNFLHLNINPQLQSDMLFTCTEDDTLLYLHNSTYSPSDNDTSWPDSLLHNIYTLKARAKRIEVMHDFVENIENIQRRSIALKLMTL